MGNTESSQRVLIREVLERGEVLTSMDALKRFGCFRCASRINELRDEGMNILPRQMVYLEDGKSIAIYFDANLMDYDTAIQKRFPGIERRDEKGRFKPLKNPLKDEEKALVRELYLSGKSLPKIYAKFPSVPQHWIYETLQEMGVKMRPPGQQGKQAEFGYAKT